MDEAEARAQVDAKYVPFYRLPSVIESWVGADEEVRNREHAALALKFDQLARLARIAAPLLRDRHTNKANKLADETEEIAKWSAESPE